MRRALLALGVIACGSPPAKAPVETWTGFADLKPRYMSVLADDTPSALEMERTLDAEREKAERAGAREELGLVLVYEALLLQRNNAHQLGGGNDAARRARAVEFLKRARELRPNDGRVASWLAGASASQEQLLAAVDVEPSFNLFTAFIAMRAEPIDSQNGKALFAKTRSFIDAKQCREPAPGTKEERNCTSGPLAPFNTQAAVVMLGDQYMRRGEDALRKGAVPDAMPLLGTANGIYATLASDKNREKTAQWSKAPLFDVRLRRLAALKPGAPVPNDDFWKSAEYESVYDCSSCHVGRSGEN
jgi:hypothetical protein